MGLSSVTQGVQPTILLPTEIIFFRLLLRPRQAATNRDGAFCACHRICQLPPAQHLRRGGAHLPRLIWPDSWERWSAALLGLIQPEVHRDQAAPRGCRLAGHMAAARGHGQPATAPPPPGRAKDKHLGREHGSFWLKTVADYFRISEITTHLASLKYVWQWAKMCDRQINRQWSYVSSFFPIQKPG